MEGCMKHWQPLWTVLLVLAAGPALAQNAYPPIPEIKYESNTDFLKLPFTMNFGEPVSVSVDGKSGDIYVANRSGISGPAYAPMANQILVFDKSGKYRHELAPCESIAKVTFGSKEATGAPFLSNTATREFT
jgi:hypothetical protein